MTLKVFHSRRIWYKVIYEKMGISASWSVSWRCQYYQQASSLLVGCSIGLVLLQQMLCHQESWYSSQVDVVCLCPFVWYPALWPVVSAVMRDIVEQAHGRLWRWEVGSYTEYVVLPVANEVFLPRLFQCPLMVGLTWVFLLLHWTSFGAVGADRQLPHAALHCNSLVGRLLMHGSVFHSRSNSAVRYILSLSLDKPKTGIMAYTALNYAICI